MNTGADKAFSYFLSRLNYYRFDDKLAITAFGCDFSYFG